MKILNAYRPVQVLAKGSGSPPYYSDDCEDENSNVKPEASQAINNIEKHDESLCERTSSSTVYNTTVEQRTTTPLCKDLQLKYQSYTFTRRQESMGYTCPSRTLPAPKSLIQSTIPFISGDQPASSTHIPILFDSALNTAPDPTTHEAPTNRSSIPSLSYTDQQGQGSKNVSRVSS
jgi:hypothetical protein